MKRTGSICDYNAERDLALLQAFRQEVLTSSIITIKALSSRIALRPCCRFWVSEERATIVISAMLRGDVTVYAAMLPSKRRMFDEIHRRVSELIKHRPRTPLSKIVAEVVNSPAPEFYLSARYVRDRLTELLRKKKKL